MQLLKLKARRGQNVMYCGRGNFNEELYAFNGKRKINVDKEILGD